jgi:hypothetical protein
VLWQEANERVASRVKLVRRYGDQLDLSFGDMLVMYSIFGCYTVAVAAFGY